MEKRWDDCLVKDVYSVLKSILDYVKKEYALGEGVGKGLMLVPCLAASERVLCFL